MNHSLKSLTLLILFFVSTGLWITGCVSIDIQPKEMPTAHLVKFVPPEAPYKEQKSFGSDHTWIDPRTASKISYVSECGSVSSMDLKAIANSVLNSAKLKVESRTSATRKGRVGLVTYARPTKGNLRVKLVTEKTKSCVYNFVLVAKDEYFSNAERVFTRFLDGVQLE